jgi:hypothetical protein
MPSYTGFNDIIRRYPDGALVSINNYRKFILGKTLKSVYYSSSDVNPTNFTEESYTYKNLSDFSNVDLDNVDTNRKEDLYGINSPTTKNTYKPEQFFIREEIDTLPRRANLNLYPYFTQGNYNLIGIMSNENYDSESELMKFAASNIRNNTEGPVFSRISQNLKAATIGRVRLIDALEGNIATATNILTGKEPLVELNNKITVASSLAGKGIDFLQTVSGIEFPFSEIPGDYLTNPKNPTENRPEAKTEFGAIVQDVTGALGSLIGIQRRPKLSRKPSDLFIEYMGQGQKQTLFDLLSYSTYAPNYTTTARSQQSSKIFNFVNQVGQGVNKLLGLEAPAGRAYIGDDRAEDVKTAMNDFNDRPVKSPFYLSLMFDSVQAVLFQRTKNITDGGSIGSQLSWISKNSKNKLGTNNQNYADQSGKLEDSLSNNFSFRQDSILGYTQEILDTMPTNGGDARSHIANVIDQTSRIFKEGDVYMSRGSAIQYVNKFGEQSGMEYCRTWTKDRPYFTYSDTMKKGTNIRKYTGSVMTNPWNLNIAPMSSGKKDFGPDSNIVEGYPFGADKDGRSFYAKKYMFSIENLAWKTSNTPGFTVLDLPYCERGPNGGRIMWFPPYGLQINESVQTKWEENTFIGRPEPIYTYINTNRTGQLSFKIVVDHPSILNLLVREHFKNMSDEEADNYINAFFAGCEDLDFYDLIRKYSTLSKDDIDLIISFLEEGKGDNNGEPLKKRKRVLTPPVEDNPGTTTVIDPGPVEPIQPKEPGIESETKSFTWKFNYDDNWPKPESGIVSGERFDTLYEKYLKQKPVYIKQLGSDITQLFNDNSAEGKRDKIKLLGTSKPTDSVTTIKNYQVNKLTKYFDDLTTRYSEFTGQTETIKELISGKTVQNIKLTIRSTASALGKRLNNRKLSLRRSNSVVTEFFKRISKDGNTVPSLNWKTTTDVDTTPISQTVSTSDTVNIKDFGWGDDYEGTITIESINYGEESTGSTGNQVETNCVDKNFLAVTSLSITAPISFYCRSTEVELSYTKLNKKPEIIETPKKEPDIKITPPTLKWTEIEIEPDEKPKKPNIDPLKRIIMKTLSECFYFKILEESSPVQFSSLKDKLKYFHPAFHSMTPEGLNARLTFLQQCLRPGDTIPIKGVAEESSPTARNTTFGPPPICILRIGDFYHSKIVIRDVNIKFDDGVWDFNPEGIGVQPMIADVSLQISFIGGQGLEKPIERLQNALSSNFYANTEIFDERAISSLEGDAKTKYEKFSKVFLQELLDLKNTDVAAYNVKVENVSQGSYISTLDTANNQLDQTILVNDLKTKVDDYFKVYESVYKPLYETWGPIISTCVVSPTYRPIDQYEVFTSSDPTSTTISLFGLPKKGKEIEILIENFKNLLIQEIESTGTSISTIIQFDKELTPEKLTRSEELLKPKIVEIIESKFQELNNYISQNFGRYFELNRNDLIGSLDKVNYITKYGFDAKIEKVPKTKKATLSGFTGELLYLEYSSYIDNIKSNTTKMYQKLDNTVDFLNPEITLSTLTSILSILLKEHTKEIMEVYEKDITGLYTPKIIEQCKKRLDSFVVTLELSDLGFTKTAPRTNDNKIKYQFEETDLSLPIEAVNEILALNTSPVNPSGNKLNYYKVAKK